MECQMRRYHKNSNGFTMAEMLITVAIIVILCGFGFVAVIAHQRNLKRMEMDETAQEIFIAAQNHLTAARASGQWSSFLEKTAAKGQEGSRGTVMSYKPSDYDKVSDADAESRKFYYFTTESAEAVKNGAEALILPEGSIDETLRGHHFYVEYDAASGTVFGVFYTDSDHPITADDATAVSLSRTDPDARRDYKVDGKRTIIGYYGGALGELNSPGDLYAPSVAVRNAESLVLYVVDKNYYRPVSSETGAANFQTEFHLMIEGETSGQKVEKTVDSNGNVYNGDQISEGRLDKNFSRAVLASDSKKDFSVGIPDGAYGSKTKSVKAKYYALVLDSIVRENGHFADLFPGLIPGEDLKIIVTLRSNAGGEDVSETVRVNSLFNSIKTERRFFGLVDDTDTTVATVSNPRHLENLSSEVSGVDFQNKQIKGNVTVDSVSIVRDLFWDTDSAAANADSTQQTGMEKVTPFLAAIDTAKGMESLYGYCADGRTSIDKNSVQVYPYTGAFAGKGSGTAGSTGTDSTTERISVGACYGITNPAIRKLEGNNHILAAFRFEGKEQSALINECAEGLEIRNLLIADATSAATGERKAAQGTGSSDTVPVAAILIANAKSGSIENIAVRWYEAPGANAVNQEVKISGNRPELASGLNGCRIYSANGIASALIGTVDAVKTDGTKESFIIKNTTVKTVASSTEKDTAHLGVEGETAAALIGEVRGGTVTLDNSTESDEKKKSTVTVEGTLALVADRGQEVNQAAGGLVGSVSNGKAVHLEEVNLTAKELTVSSEKSAGGLVGESASGTSDSSLTVEKVNLSANALDVTGKKAAGGAIGNTSAGTVTLKKINVLTTKAAGDNGEAGQTATGTEKIYGIRITAEHGKAGGFVGAAESGVNNLTIESCAVSGSGTADQIEAGSSAGGLIGDSKATTTSITGSMASMYVRSEGNGGNANGTSSTDGAGGLIGSASGSVTINDSYSGGRTQKADDPDKKAGDASDERARYVDSTTGQGRYNVYLVKGNGAAGGLVGISNGTLSIRNSYSASSVAVRFASSESTTGGAAGGGLVGSADNLIANNTYCTGRVYAKKGASGSGQQADNSNPRYGAYAGKLGNFSGEKNYYLKGMKGAPIGAVGTLGNDVNPPIEDSQLTGADYYDNSCPLKNGVSENQKTYTFDSSLRGQSYPYKTVNTSFAKPLYDPATGEKVENADQDDVKYAQIGDWEIPEEETTEFGPYALIYYERIWNWNPDTQSLDPTFYYHGYALPDGAKGTDGSVAYTEISTPQDKLPAGTTWNNHHLVTSKNHYVAEDGYLLLISKGVLNESSESEWRIELKASGALNNDSIASIKNTGWNLDLTSLEKYKGDLSSSAELRGYTAYSLESIGDSNGWDFRPNGQNFGVGLTLWEKGTFNNNDSVPEVGFTYIPFFADAVRGADQGRLQSVSKAWAWDSSTSQYFVNSPASAVIRSARQLRRFAAFDNGQYGYLSKTDKEISIEQRMDITFNSQRVTFYDQGEVTNDPSWYQSPTINKMSVGGDGGSFSSALREGVKENSKDYYVLDGLNNKLIGEMHGGRLYNLQITNMQAEVAVEKINFELNSVSVWNISVTNSEFARGIIGTLDQANVSNLEIKNSTFTNNGFAEIVGQKCTITNCTMRDVRVGKNGFSSSIDRDSKISNCSIVDAVIGENGFAETIGQKCTITNCTMRDVRVGKNGFSSSIDQDSEISNCSIVNAVIGKNGFANETKASIQDCTIINAIIGKNGFAYQNSGTITSCGIYGNEDKYSDNPAEEDYSEYYQPNTHTMDDNVTGSEDKAYGYNLVTIGITAGGNKSADSDIAGFVNQNTGNITGCYVAGKVYGQNNVAGFVVKHAAGTSITNSYSNVLIYAGKNVSGFANELADYNGSIRNCHALGMISCQGDASGAISQITNGTVQGVYQAFWKVNAKNWYPFYKIQSAGNVQNNYYLADCEINADDSELVDYGQKVKALSHQQLCDLSIDSLQKGATEKNTTGYYQYMNKDDDHKIYPYPMPDGMTAYGDWSHEEPDRYTLLYYEKVNGEYYFHGYATEDGENYKAVETSGDNLENGLLAETNKTVMEDGYILITGANGSWSAFGRSDNSGNASSPINNANTSIFKDVSSDTDLQNALKDLKKKNTDKIYAFQLDKYLAYEDTTKNFASWQTLTKESGGIGISIYSTKGMTPMAKFSFQPFFADTVKGAQVSSNGSTADKKISFVLTTDGDEDHDYRIRSLRQLQALSDWDAGIWKNTTVADSSRLKENFDKDNAKRYSYLSTLNENYTNGLKIRQDMDINVDGANVNFDRLDGTYAGKQYSDRTVMLQNLKYDFADMVAPGGVIDFLVIDHASLQGTASTAEKNGDVAHGGQREFVEYNYGTISNITVQNSELGSAGLVYQNGDVSENVVSIKSTETDNYPRNYQWIPEIGDNVCQYGTKKNYEANTEILSGTIEKCVIQDSSIIGAGIVWKNIGGNVKETKVQKCSSIGYVGIVAYNQATHAEVPTWTIEYQYKYQNKQQNVTDELLKTYKLPIKEESATKISVSVDAIIENCQVIDCTVKGNGFVGENTVNTVGSSADNNSGAKAKISNCQVYGTSNYSDMKIGSSSGASDVNKVAGFVGNNGKGAEIENCSVTGQVGGRKNVAGFALTNAGTITGSYANTKIACEENQGTMLSGFVLTNTGTIDRSHSLGEESCKQAGSGADNQAAGFVVNNQKANDSSTNAVIRNSYAAMWKLELNGTNYVPFGSIDSSSGAGSYDKCYAMKLSADDGYSGTYSTASASGITYVSGEELKKKCDDGLGNAAGAGKTTAYQAELKSTNYPFPCGSTIMNYGDWKLTDGNSAATHTITLAAGSMAVFPEDVVRSLSADAAVMAASDDGNTENADEAAITGTENAYGLDTIPEEDRHEVQLELGEEEETLDLAELVPVRKGWKLLGWLITSPSELSASEKTTTVSDVVTKINKLSDGDAEASGSSKAVYELETGTKSYHYAPDAVITVTEDMTLSAVWVPDDDTIEKAKDGTLRMDENGNILEDENEAESTGTTETSEEGTTESSTAGTTETPEEGTTESATTGTTESPEEGTTEPSTTGTTEMSETGATESTELSSSGTETSAE